MQIRKKGGMKLKKSSSLKLQSQSQPNFAEMILGWSSSKIVSKLGKSSKFIKNPVIYVKKLIIMLIQFKFGHFLGTLNFYRFWPIMKFKKGGMKLKKNLLLWNYRANFNQTLLKWSLGGPLLKLCPSAPSYIQSFQQSFVEIGSVVSEEKIFFNSIPPFFQFA
jgi:hypothetical protein